MSKNISLIFAQSQNGVIGKDSDLPWDVPEDFAHFVKTTKGHIVVMGRRTWDSLPPKFRPLPDRTNLVVTRQKNLHIEGAQVFNSLEQALTFKGYPGQETWVMGGSQIYQESIPFANKMVVTEIDLVVDGDTFSPKWKINEWTETAREKHQSATGISFSVVTYQRTKAAAF